MPKTPKWYGKDWIKEPADKWVGWIVQRKDRHGPPLLIWAYDDVSGISVIVENLHYHCECYCKDKPRRFEYQWATHIRIHYERIA